MRLSRNKYQFATGVRFKIDKTKIDYFLVFSIILPIVFLGTFWFLASKYLLNLVYRLDEKVKTSWMLILIPFWLAMIPTILLTVLHGLTDTNAKISLIEKLVISFVTPRKLDNFLVEYLISFVLIIFRHEEIINARLVYLFIPNFISVLCFYL